MAALALAVCLVALVSNGVSAQPCRGARSRRLLSAAWEDAMDQVRKECPDNILDKNGCPSCRTFRYYTDKSRKHEAYSCLEWSCVRDPKTNRCSCERPSPQSLELCYAADGDKDVSVGSNLLPSLIKKYERTCGVNDARPPCWAKHVASDISREKSAPKPAATHSSASSKIAALRTKAAAATKAGNHATALEHTEAANKLVAHHGKK